MKQQTKTVIKLVLGLLIILAASLALPAHAEAPMLTPEETLTLKLTNWLDKLAECESGHYNKAINKYDVGSRSVGLFQFKDSTFLNYSKRYKLGYKPEDIWDGNKQTQVALRMLKENINNQNQWYNCSKKIGRL